MKNGTKTKEEQEEMKWDEKLTYLYFQLSVSFFSLFFSVRSLF